MTSLSDRTAGAAARGLRGLAAMAIAGGALQPAVARACAACYGQSDAPMAKGMNWGIFTLLCVVVCVLGGVASFFVYLGKRSAATGGGAASSSTPEARP